MLNFVDFIRFCLDFKTIGKIDWDHFQFTLQDSLMMPEKEHSIVFAI